MNEQSDSYRPGQPVARDSYSSRYAPVQRYPRNAASDIDGHDWSRLVSVNTDSLSC
ncbi:hypothetical protein HFX_6096 (plasmid) [Haloferax mediterranei ATCC 33500]|uniref:Uncharacterized protein n=1 Tax=Haloferax mediterranei (strain ATCC 33500 / DSM 1411 / JCM 8866 / NBRC 14739 / NCIMB 2177 / R-4) TaxID=523841 RepID=I3RAG2_HALMT|nr:hypothetical protein HFX_6096 [Haloferax mediterranei ATCC 33500]